ETADALVIKRKPVEVVTRDERVIGIDRVIKTWTEERIALGCNKRVTDFQPVEVFVKHSRANQLVVVGFDASEVDEERRLSLDDGSAEIHIVLANLKRCSLAGRNRKRITRVQTL